LGFHFGIIFALIGVELIFLPLSVIFERWHMDRTKTRGKVEKEEKEREAEKRSWSRESERENGDI